MEGDADYIGKEVTQPLINAIAEVCNQRPHDPISFIANSLYEYRQEHQLSQDNRPRENIKEEYNQQDNLILSEASEDMGCNSSVAIATNSYDTTMDLPKYTPVSCPDKVKCVTGSGSSKWPIRCFAPLKPTFNVNTHHGGGAALIQVSNAYGGDGADTTAEVLLLRCGFDGNHISVSNISKSHHGHFGPETSAVTNECGDLYLQCLFGSNHVSIISNLEEYGTLSHGLVLQADYEGNCDLPINVNGAHSQHGGGCTLILCSSSEGQDKLQSAVYMIRSGHKDNNLQVSLISGDDKWKFNSDDKGILQAGGVAGTVFAVYHNRENVLDQDKHMKGQAHTQYVSCIDGSVDTLLFSSYVPCEGALLVLCSSNSGDEDATVASVYLVSLQKADLTFKHIAGNVGLQYGTDKTDLWTFKMKERQVLVTGPSDPCRYSVISNLTVDIPETIKPTTNCCLATGEPEAVTGVVTITDKTITGWLTKESEVLVKDNEKEVFVFTAKDLRLNQGKYAFHTNWPSKMVGLHYIRVFALRKRLRDGAVCEIELKGSPWELVIQPEGVVHTVNIASPTYQAIDGVVYESEFTRYINLDRDHGFGTKCKAYGGIKAHTGVPQILCGTEDPDLYSRYRTRHVEAVDEQKVIYVVNDVENKSYTLRLHFVGTGAGQIYCNGRHISKDVAEYLYKNKNSYSYVAHKIDVPITVENSTFELKLDQMSAFALLDKSYKQKTKDKKTLQEEQEESIKLINESDPLPRTMTRKERKIVGWSSNLLQNPSAEKDLSFWNVTGNWKSTEGGFGTEKAFVSSHMDCIKYQEVNLLDYFDMEYLDTAPQIQISEHYREGSCGGGYYTLKASLLDKNGKKLATFDTGEIGRIYRNNKWEQISHTFHSYGTGVRRVAFESHGRDDKYWAGHFGTMTSGAVVRVKREAKAAENDAFKDLDIGMAGETVKSQNAEKDKLVRKVLSDNEELTEVLMEDSVIPEVDKSFQKQTALQKRVSFTDHKKKFRKREIRIFVSSTFRDFKEEREEIIKKTFREINAMCADRGIFFTYVDLRWGITEDQTCHGQTIAICLQEIDRCRPYFVCIMGDRFGWCQKVNSPDKLLNQSFDYAINNFPAQYNWLESCRYDNSVTKLEVLHGVLNDIELNKDRSFFYLRDNIKQAEVGEEEYKIKGPESEWHAQQQNAFRQKIKEKADILNVRDYSELNVLCELVKKDIERCINKDYPAGTELTALQRERQAHIAFAQARERVYIGREEYFTKIMEFIDIDQSQPLVVLGESGSGKSALIANFTSRLGLKEESSFIFLHFIGSSAESASSVKLLRRLFEEMKEFFGFHLPIPTSDANLARDLPTWLRLAGAEHKCFIILDALNQLDDGGDGKEQDLLWIPKELPPGVNMLLSTLPGRAFVAVEEAGWPHMKVDPLKSSEKFDIVTGYLEGIYGKTLSQEQKDLIVNTEKTNNPLYLKALLDEVRMFGNFRKLTSKIEEYLLADTPGDLFSKILERFEADFEEGINGRPGLVKDTTSAIWCSHRGMSESELLEFLEVPSAVFSPFYLSLRENLINRNGLLNFFHDHLRQAVQNKYLSSEDERHQQFVKLAEYFDHRTVDQRKVDELPFLLAKVGDLEKLKTTLSDIDVFKKLVGSEDGKFDLIKSWQLLGDFSQVVDSYSASLKTIPESEKESDEYAKLQQDLAEFYVDLGLFTAARSMFTQVLSNLEKKYKKSHGTIVCSPGNQTRKYRCNHPSIIKLLHNLGEVCEKQKDLKQAEEYFAEAIRRQSNVVTPTQKLTLTQGLLGQATVLYISQKISEAKKYLVRAREIATGVLGSRHHYVAAIINKLGQLCYKQGRLDEALGYFTQDLKLTRGEVGTSHPRTAVIFNDLALVYDDKNDHLAGELYEATLQTLLLTYGNQHVDVAVTRYNLGCFYFATNYFARAKYQFSEALKIYTLFLGDGHPDTLEAKEAFDDVSAFC